MPDKKVLLTMICPKNLGLHESDFQQFPTVFYEENTQEALLFIPAQALGDAQLALQAYSERHPAAKDLQLIPLQDPQDFLRLAAKTAPGPGGGCFDTERKSTNTLGYGASGVDVLFDTVSKSSYSWSMLCDQDRMCRAARSDIIPYQNLPRDLYQCGVNSAARCFIMMTGSFPTKEDYERFRDNCPRTFTKDTPEEREGAAKAAFASGILGMVLAPFTGESLLFSVPL